MLGAPGSGKGTRAKFISEYYGIPNISTGDLFRENIENKTPLGIKVNEIMKTGKLCPDDLTIEMVKERLKKDDCKNGYLLDGFPRNLYQAEALDKISSPDKIFNIEIALEKIEKRITGRRICSSCHSTFHIDVIGENKTCPSCGGAIIKRKDDEPEIVRERIKVYLKQTAPLTEYYKKQNKLVNIDGDGEIDKIIEDIKKVLK